MDDSEWLALAPDDRHRCADCFHLVESQGCFVAMSRKQRGIKAKELMGDFPSRQYFPDPAPLRRCEFFKSKNEVFQNDTTKQSGLPNLRASSQPPDAPEKRSQVRGNHAKTITGTRRGTRPA